MALLSAYRFAELEMTPPPPPVPGDFTFPPQQYSYFPQYPSPPAGAVFRSPFPPGGMFHYHQQQQHHHQHCYPSQQQQQQRQAEDSGSLSPERRSGGGGTIGRETSGRQWQDHRVKGKGQIQPQSTLIMPSNYREKPKKTRDGDSKYKTVMCRFLLADKECPYGDACCFAHSREELRSPKVDKRRKTRPCMFFFQDGYCPYGVKCHFTHDMAEYKEKVATEEKDRGLVLFLTKRPGSRLAIFEEMASKFGGHEAGYCGSAHHDRDAEAEEEEDEDEYFPTRLSLLALVDEEHEEGECGATCHQGHADSAESPFDPQHVHSHVASAHRLKREARLKAQSHTSQVVELDSLHGLQTQQPECRTGSPVPQMMANRGL